MAEFRINDHLYRNRKLNAKQQFHVMRRIAPVVGPMSMIIVSTTTDDPEGMARQMAMTTPVLEALAQMTDEDCDYVINVCMGATQRQSGGNGSGPTVWSDVWNAAARREMFDDIDMGEMLQICWNVIQDSLRGFSSIRQGQPVDHAMAEPTPA